MRWEREQAGHPLFYRVKKQMCISFQSEIWDPPISIPNCRPGNTRSWKMRCVANCCKNPQVCRIFPKLCSQVQRTHVNLELGLISTQNVTFTWPEYLHRLNYSGNYSEHLDWAAGDVFQCLSSCCISLRRRRCEWHLTDWQESVEIQLKTRFKPPPNVGLDLICKFHVSCCSADLNKAYYITAFVFILSFILIRKGFIIIIIYSFLSHALKYCLWQETDNIKRFTSSKWNIIKKLETIYRLHLSAFGRC